MYTSNGTDTMPTEFELSIINHGVASGRDANCYFQSFFHILTNQSIETLDALKTHYPNAIRALVDTFNQKLDLETPVDFHGIIEISRELHPLEREYIFGPILRHTYNTMVERNILPGGLLHHHPDAIMLSTQTGIFANAFGAELKVYMSQEQLGLSVKSGMPSDVAERVKRTHFEIEDRIFYCDNPPNQQLKGPKLFEVDLIYADVHLNYTLGTRSLNNENRNQIVTRRTETKDGIFAVAAAPGSYAPLANDNLSFPEILNGLRERFSLVRKAPEEFKIDMSSRQSDLVSQRSSTAFMAKEMQFVPQVSESKSAQKSMTPAEPQSPASPLEQRPSEMRSPSSDLQQPTHHSVRR